MKRAVDLRIRPTLVKVYEFARRCRPVEMALDFLLSRWFPNAGIPFLERASGTGSMESDWDSRARLNPWMAATGERDMARARASVLRSLETQILDQVPLHHSWVVLEIGCGIGNVLDALSERVREIHGIDISGEMLKRAADRVRARPNVQLHKVNGRLDIDMFSSQYFDFVFASGVFIHFPEKSPVYEYFREAARVLKPGGIFRFQTDGRSYLKWRARKGGTVRGVVFTPEEITSHLAEQGFVDIRITGHGTPNMWTTARRSSWVS